MALDAVPSLEEVIIDKNKPVLLRLSDRTTRILPYGVDLVDALERLHAAQQQWQLQGRVPSDSDDENDDLQLQLCQGQADYHFNSAAATQQPDISYPAGQFAAAPAAGSAAASAMRHASHFAGMFRQDGRMGVPGTLHRISVLRNASGSPVGLTYRLGRHVPNKALPLADVLSCMKASIMPGSAVER